MEEKEHFLAQYNQIWQQRRQHVSLVWTIPTVAFGVMTLLVQVLFPEEGIVRMLRLESVLALIIIGIGLSGLLLRHNFFIKCLGLLLQEQDGRRVPFVLPQFGNQFREIYREGLGFWEKIGAIKNGTFWWLVVSYGFILLLITITVDLMSASFLKDTLELLKAYWWAFPLILTAMFLWESAQYSFSTEKIKRIRELAYQFYVQGHYQQGHDLDHWLRAEEIVNSKGCCPEKMRCLTFYKIGKCIKYLFPFACLILWWVFRTSGDVRLFVACLLLAFFVYFKRIRKSFPEVVLVIFLAVLLALGTEGVRDWNLLIKEKSKELIKLRVDKGGATAEFGHPAQANVSNEDPLSQPKSQLPVKISFNDIESIRKLTQNLLVNGDFRIPLESNLSGWGAGLYTDQVRRFYSEQKIVWINFRNADINISIEKTERGSALKITNRSGAQDHVVGVMEQRIRVTPGMYKLSYWARAEADFEAKGIMFSTRDDWVGQPELSHPGPFEWKEFSHEIETKESGLITFSIISKGKGTIYLTDITLTKQSDDKNKPI